jgi:hypothetical protein
MIKNLRRQQIELRREKIPRKYRRLYDRAVSGKSLRASINTQCLECCEWISKEVILCSDLGCPLFSVRPYRSSGSARKRHLVSVESKSCKQGRLW